MAAMMACLAVYVAALTAAHGAPQHTRRDLNLLHFSFPIHPRRPPPSDSSDDVLSCPTIRHLLEPRPSPFVMNNNYGGGFADDGESERDAIKPA